MEDAFLYNVLLYLREVEGGGVKVSSRCFSEEVLRSYIDDAHALCGKHVVVAQHDVIYCLVLLDVEEVAVESLDGKTHGTDEDGEDVDAVVEGVPVC